LEGSAASAIVLGLVIDPEANPGFDALAREERLAMTA
jgi:hypothetical protein